jgi:trk system potassium uptake protein
MLRNHKTFSVGVIQRILGQLLMLFSLTMLAPAAVSLVVGDGQFGLFVSAFIVLMVFGSFAWLPVRNSQGDLRLKDGFLIVALFWAMMGLAGALPLLMAQPLQLSFTGAVFESVSGFTTTGATVLTGLDNLPPSILYYRHQTQWLGGLGIVVLAVALFPLLGIGGMQLLKAETTGPMKETRVTTRITGTAKALWIVYVVITLAGVAAYWLAGMPLLDAIGHSFSAVSTGGFSSHDASIGYFKSPTIEWITVLLMLLGGISFTLHFLAWRHRRLGDYWRDHEFKGYLAILGVTSFISLSILIWHDFHGDHFTSLRSAIFHAVSVQTSTGYTTESFALWPGVLPVLLIFVSFVGGCAGSTAGGMKIIRWMLVARQGARETAKLIHPNAEIAVKLGTKAMDGRVIGAVWGFFAVYILAFVVLMLLLMATGVDQVTAFSAVATCMNNLGPGLGEVASAFTTISAEGLWICTLAMLLGRLEIFPLLVLVSPAFWRN